MNARLPVPYSPFFINNWSVSVLQLFSGRVAKLEHISGHYVYILVFYLGLEHTCKNCGE